MEEILDRFNPWWTRKPDFPGIARETYLSMLLDLKTTKDVVLITGLRRVGKTTLMQQVINKLLEEVSSDRIFYVSLDNIALKDHTILDIVDGFRRSRSLKHDDFAYLFLDEVHVKKDYELQLKNLYDTGNAKIFASGSSSLDIIMKSPYLTGRQRIIRIEPLGFGEYLRFLGKDISPSDSHLFVSLAEEYIENGGMPEFVKTRDPNVLQSLIDSVLYRDIAGRHSIRNSEYLPDMLSWIAQSVGAPVSLRKASRVLGIPVETVSRTINLFVEANLVHLVEREGKLSERKASPRKLYIADTGLFGVLTENVTYGAMVENLVYLALKKRGTVRYHRADGKEIDFVRGKHAWEAKYKSAIAEDDIDILKGLRGCKARTVVTKDKSGVMDGVALLPLWKFLLANEEVPKGKSGR